MTIETDEQLEAMKRVGALVAQTLREMRGLVEPGMTTRELDDLGAAILVRLGLRSAPPMVYNFPGAFCLSLNDEAAHGVPGERALVPGDLVKIDLTAELDGYMADAAVTVPVGEILPARRKLVACAEAALTDAIASARTGRRLNELGRTVEMGVKKRGFTVIRELCGHGVGRTIHESPRLVPSYFERSASERLVEGSVVALEPHITSGGGRIRTASDGWTLQTTDRSPVANFEHTIMVTSGKPVILTAGL